MHAVLTERARIDDEVKGPEVSASTVQKISTGAVRSDVAHIRLELHRHILVEAIASSKTSRRAPLLVSGCAAMKLGKR